MRRVNFSVLARELFTSRAKTKKISRRFSGKHGRQSDHFWFVFPSSQVIGQNTGSMESYDAFRPCTLYYGYPNKATLPQNELTALSTGT